MQIAGMRLLDRWVGIPLTAVLTGVRRIEDVLRDKRSEPPQRIVIIKLVEQGATVVAEPALRRAIDRVGRDNVFMTVFADNRFIVDVLDVIPRDNVITIRDDNLFICAVDTLRALWRIRRERIDTAIDFEFFSRFSGALTYLTGARRRVGFHSYGGEAGYRGDLMTHRVAYNVALHAGEIYSVLVAAAFMPPDGLPMVDVSHAIEQPVSKFEPAVAEVRAVEATVRRELGRENIPPFMLFNANSGDMLPLRRWAPQRYVELAKRLLQKYPQLAIAFTGSPEEQAEAETLVGQVGSDRCFSLAGQTTLRELLVLYGLADVLVTNDSGPAHFASLTPIDIVALFGPETPAVFGPTSPRGHVIHTALACSPCVNAFNQRHTTCTTNLCMQRIPVDEVFEKVCRVFEQRHQVVGLELRNSPPVADGQEGSVADVS